MEDNEPDKRSEFLLIVLDVAAELLFNPADGGNRILEGILPGLQALGLGSVRHGVLKEGREVTTTLLS